MAPKSTNSIIDFTSKNVLVQSSRPKASWMDYSGLGAGRTPSKLGGSDVEFGNPIIAWDHREFAYNAAWKTESVGCFFCGMKGRLHVSR